jgi:[acyl-carrier-protein] S-malonyltransferase
MDVVLLFPGQGSQKPGMGKDLAEAFDAARDVFQQVDEALGEPLSKVCFDGPVDVLTETRNAQPALLTHGAAVWAVVGDHLLPHVRAAAGHSLGEFTAYHAAAALSLTDAARLVRSRGELMQQTGTMRPGTMAAILGELSRPIDDICAEASASVEGGLVVPANYNAGDQVVVSGEIAGVEHAMNLAKAAGAKRAIRLAVSGAFHSPLMAPAQEGLAAALATTTVNDPVFPVYANVNAARVRDAGVAKSLLIDQLVSPVRWTETISRLRHEFPSAVFVELGPGSVLTGLVRRTAPDAQALTCGNASDLNSLMAMVAV